MIKTHTYLNANAIKSKLYHALFDINLTFVSLTCHGQTMWNALFSVIMFLFLQNFLQIKYENSKFHFMCLDVNIK